MTMLILLLCSIPSLAVMAVAVIYGFRTGSRSVLTMLLLSALLVSGSAVLSHVLDQEPVPRIRFANAESGAVASRHRIDDPVRLAWRRDLNEMQR